MPELLKLLVALAASFSGAKTAAGTIAQAVFAGFAVTLVIAVRSSFDTWTPAAYIVLVFFVLLLIALLVLTKASRSRIRTQEEKLK